MLLGAAPLSAAAACLDPALPRGESRSSIRLAGNMVGPYFYFRSFDYNLAILIKGEMLQAALKSAAAGGNRDATELLALVSKDLPLTRSTDLFGYVLQDPYRLSVIQRVVGILLGRGDAAVIDARTGSLLPSIDVKHENSQQARRRVFSYRGVILLQSLDCIEN